MTEEERLSRRTRFTQISLFSVLPSPHVREMKTTP